MSFLKQNFMTLCSTLRPVSLFIFKDRGNPTDDGQRDRTFQRLRLHIGNRNLVSMFCLGDERHTVDSL